MFILDKIVPNFFERRKFYEVVDERCIQQNNIIWVLKFKAVLFLNPRSFDISKNKTKPLVQDVEYIFEEHPMTI